MVKYIPPCGIHGMLELHDRVSPRFSLTDSLRMPVWSCTEFHHVAYLWTHHITSTYLVILALEKPQTQSLFPLEQISGVYRPPHSGFKPGFPSGRRVSLHYPPAPVHANENHRDKFVQISPEGLCTEDSGRTAISSNCCVRKPCC